MLRLLFPEESSYYTISERVDEVNGPGFKTVITLETQKTIRRYRGTQ